MDDISKDLAENISGIWKPEPYLVCLAAVLVLAAITYLVRCYIQESTIRKRIQRRIHRTHGGNVVSPEVVILHPEKLPQPRPRYEPPPAHAPLVTVHRRQLHPWRQSNRPAPPSASPASR